MPLRGAIAELVGEAWMIQLGQGRSLLLHLHGCGGGWPRRQQALPDGAMHLVRSDAEAGQIGRRLAAGALAIGAVAWGR